MTRALLASAAWYVCAACLVYLIVIAALFAITAVLAAREQRRRAGEARLDDVDTLRASPFTIPVSVIVPAYNEAICILPVVRSLLALDYPEYEVIVVDDGSTDGTVARLRGAFALEATGTFYRDTLAAAAIQHIYRSRRDSRLVVASKANGGKADALNCGINLARYRYVCCVDADTMYRPEALLRGMRLVVDDPARVIGVTSRVEVGARPERLARAGGRRARIDRALLMVFQGFDYLRAFINVRQAWSRANYMLCASGAFAIWRRDVLLELGGFSPRFTCEDIEFTFRVHERFRAAGIPYRIHALADAVGITEGPTTVGGLVRQRSRWQRVVIETIWHYRRMLGNRRYGTVGLIGMPYYVFGEVLAPVFQLAALLAIPMALAGGVLRWGELASMLAIVSLGLAIFTGIAILLHDQAGRPFAPRDLAYLMLLAPVDLLVYRPIILYAQWKGTIDFMRGERGWNKADRNPR
jgi:cellulose synthase/poly-beta-1,6-N-acetylglucosamine synthase-like glycosyltransferase